MDKRATAYLQVKQAFYDGTVKLQPEVIALEVDLTRSETPKNEQKLLVLTNRFK